MDDGAVRARAADRVEGEVAQVSAIAAELVQGFADATRRLDGIRDS